MEFIPLNKLDISDDNVRQKPNPEFELRLSHDIEARGVLQNLIVAKGKKRGRYDIIGGGKRKRAMQLVVERGKMEADHPTPCLVIDRRQHNAGEVSLAENFQRLQMTPAEECQAFQHFIKEDGDTAGVAKRFGLTQRFVEGRLRLANLAEPIFDALAAGDITLDIAKAYAATDKHEVQLRVFEQMRYAYSPSADAIRRLIADGSMRGNDPIALLVGEDAYVEAGGTIERDLFSEAADDRWIDVEIAHKLAAAKMEAEAERPRRIRGRREASSASIRYGCLRHRSPKKPANGSMRSMPGSRRSMTSSMPVKRAKMMPAASTSKSSRRSMTRSIPNAASSTIPCANCLKNGAARSASS